MKKRKLATAPSSSSSCSRISVLIPCRNAKPWLDAAVISLLSQVDVDLEIIIIDDGSTDGSWERLVEISQAQEKRRTGGEEEEARKEGGGGEDDDDLFFLLQSEDENETTKYPKALDGKLREKLKGATVERICKMAARCSEFRKHKIVCKRLDRDQTKPSGQGLALNMAFALSTCAFIGEMESDDVRPANCFKKLLEAFSSNDDDLDAVFSKIALIGDTLEDASNNKNWGECVGMRRFERWQNGLENHCNMKNSIYVEIPAMRASGLYRREFLEKWGPSPYDDLWRVGEEIIDCAAETSAENKANKFNNSKTLHHWWPVDVSFFHRAFNADMRCTKIKAKMYWWRQYAKQSTKTHDRCSLERLRAAKVHYLLREDGPLGIDAVFPMTELNGDATETKKLILRVFGRGKTLNAFISDINREIAHLLEEKTPSSSRRLMTYVVEKKDELPGLPKRKRKKENLPSNVRLARLFAFGMDKARNKVLRAVTDFDHGGLDWFVA